MGWVAVWQLALKQFGTEAVEIRITILVAAAFVTLMILVGLRHAFRSAEPKSAAPPPEVPRRVSVAPLAAVQAAPVPQVSAPPQPFRQRKPPLRATRKCAKRAVNRQRAMRPLIRRELTKCAEFDAPSSPRPPRG